MKRVTVVGGGIIGLCTAYYLAHRGHRVTIIERDAPRHDCCSLGNAGMIVPSHFVPLAAPGMVSLGLRMLANPQSPFSIRPKADPALIDWCWKFMRACNMEHVRRASTVLRDLNLASRRCYEALADEAGLDFGLTRRGLLMLCKTERTLREETHLVERARRLGLNAEALTPEQTAHLDPNIRMDIAGAVYFPQDCHLNPNRLIAGLTQRLEQMGVQFIWDTEITEMKTSGNRVGSLRSAKSQFEADAFVIAGGAWSSQLAKAVGVYMPMQAGKGYSMTLERPRQLPAICSILTEARVAVTPMGEKLRFAGTMEITGLDLSVSRPRVDGIIRSIPRYYPEFGPSDFGGAPVWSGLRPCSPDGLPYLGRFRDSENLYVASGHSMMGLSLGPISGRLIAELVSDEKPSISLEQLRPDRYSPARSRAA